MAFYHYASEDVRLVIVRSVPWRVPNTDRLGRPREVYFTDSLFHSIAAAEAALQIGALHPKGPHATPHFRCEIDLTGCTYTNLGAVAGGTATEYATPDQPQVTAIIGMNP